jgi:hypothetical protein
MAYSQTLPALVKAETSLDRIVGIRSLAQGQGRDTGIEHMTGAERMARNQKMKEMEEMRHTTLAKLKVAKGVAHLGVGNWEAAAREFMTVDGKLEDWEGKVSFGCNVISLDLGQRLLNTLPPSAGFLAVRHCDVPQSYFSRDAQSHYHQDVHP